MKLKDTIICDLDGTFANCEHRLHHIQKQDSNGLKHKPDWDAFFAEIRYDTPNMAVAHVLEKFYAYEGHRFHIIFCSGRPERCRADTVEWLKNEHIHPDEYTLFMRKDGDYRADSIVKQEILDQYIDKERVLFVLDDRQQVVDMWRSNGLTCFQVAPGNF